MAEVTLTSAMRNNLAQLRATSMLMDSTQNRIATGNKVNSALDDPTAFFKAKGLKDDANDLAVLKDDMGQTISAIQAADKAITSITSLVEQAKSLANSAKSESSSAERLSLAAQFDDIRAQIDTLAADASYGGQNLVTGRGVITGGTFLDTSSTAEAALAGVGTGGIARTGTDTNVGDYTFAVDQKLNDLNTVMVGSTTISTTIVGSTGGGTTTAGDQLDFYIDGVKAGTVTMGATATETGTTYAAKIDALSSDLTAAMSSNALNITVAQGKVLEIREGTTIGTSGGLLTDLGLSAGLQNDSTGATVVDLTSDLGVYGAEIYAHVNGYTPDANSTNVTFAVSGTTLTITDGTTGSTATMDTTVFSTAGTDTLAVGDMTVNFVTTLSTEQTNTQPTVAGTVSAVAQISTATWNTTTALATQIDTITIANAEVGDVYTAIVDGVTYAFTATDTNETNVAAGLASAISTAAGTLATTSASAVVTLTAATSGTPFTATATTTDRTRDNTQSIATATGTAHSAGATSQISTVTIAGTVEIGDVFTVNMTSDNDGTADYTFTATAATVTSVATGLAGLLDADADITATITNGVITLNEQASAGSGFTFNSSAANDKATDNTQSATQATATANGPGYSTGDAITVVINGNSYTHTLTAPALTRTLAATAFYDAMKATIEAAENVTVTDNSAHVLTFTSDTAGDVFTISATQSALVGAAEGAPTVATGTSNVVQESTVAIAANIDDGDVYSVTINGTAISYTATTADTTQTMIATALTSAINANTTLVNGASGVLQTVTSSGATITISENSLGTSLSITASANDAAISLGNASSTSSTQVLKSLTTGTATGDMRIKVTSGGLTETVDVNTSSTTAATVSNSAWGSTFTFTADDSTMSAGESTTVSVTNPTGKGENDATVVFNTDGTSTINVEAVDITASGLSITGAAGSWAANADIEAALAELGTAKDSLRSNSKTMATSLGVIQTRETFTENFIDNLRVGADKLTLADGSEEATNMLMLQTRQQLGIQALSMASQSSQSILSLFR